MIIVCAWCGLDLGEKEPLADTSVTHSICPECADEERRKEEELDAPRIRKRYPRGYWTDVDRLYDERI